MEKIKLENRLKGDMKQDCLLSNDGVDFQVPEPQPFSKDNFSHKFNGPGIRYEVALSIKSGDICWINGPFPPGKYNDLQIFRQGLRDKLMKNERVLCDSGYYGDDPEYCCTKNGFRVHRNKEEKKLYRKAINTILGRHETVNGRMKWFQCLTSYRHSYEKHKIFFTAIAVIVQVSIETDSQLFHIEESNIIRLQLALLA